VASFNLGVHPTPPLRADPPLAGAVAFFSFGVGWKRVVGFFGG